MFQITKIPGRTVQTNQGEHLWFGGTSYLGIPHNDQFQNLIQFGLENYGANWGSSRNNPLQLKVYDMVENFLAKFVSAPAALTVSSGMLAGQLVLRFLKNNHLNSSIIYAPRVHPALWETNYFPNNISFAQFQEEINERINESKSEIISIVVDAVSSPHFEKYDFEWVKTLPKSKKINLIIDDSHSIGVLGENGGGIYAQIYHPENINLIVIASLNKALGVPGGVIFGNAQLINEIRQTTFFSACSPMSPAFAYACASANEIYEKELLTLKSNISYFNEFLQTNLNSNNQIGHPAYCFDQEGLQANLLNQHILVPSFGYPNPTDKAITRLVISSLHSKKDLDYLLTTLNAFANNG